MEHPIKKRSRRTFSAAKIAVVCIVMAAAAGITEYFSAHHSASPPPSPAQSAAIPVMTATAASQDVPIILRGLGAVTAYNTVAVKSRVGGQITKINFKEGQEVKAGDLLIQIDARPFQATLDQAVATLAKDQANLANARADLERYAKLLKQSFAPEQQYATQKATVAQDEAIVRSDQAAIDAAKLNVEYASIRSPVDGIIGIKQVDLGNLVQADSQTLAVVTQIKPVYVVFPIPEVNIQQIRTAMAEDKLSVLAYDAADEKQISSGVLDLIDNQVDQTTGTVKLKAEFANADEALWPGQFVNAHLIQEVVADGVTVPAAAVQIGPQGSFVYVVGSNDTVEMRAVKVTQTENNVSLIGSGLKAGEQVVTGGVSKLSPGAKVKPTNSEGNSSSAPATAGNRAIPGTRTP